MLRAIGLWTAVLGSMLTFAGCQTAPLPKQRRDAAADLKTINGLRDQFTAAYNSKHAAACYADDAILMLPNQPAIKGRQPIQAWIETYFKENSAKMVHTPLETQVAGDWAYEGGTSRPPSPPSTAKRWRNRSSTSLS